MMNKAKGSKMQTCRKCSHFEAHGFSPHYGSCQNRLVDQKPTPQGMRHSEDYNPVPGDVENDCDHYTLNVATQI